MQRIIINKNNKKIAIATIGCFDGIHLGHQELFKSMAKIASANNYKTIVITFEPLPLEYFYDQLDKPRLTRLSLLRDKVDILKNLGYIDEVVVLHFNSSIANLNPKEFIAQILKERLNIAHIVIGYDFKFGKNGTGNTNDLKEDGIIVSEIRPYLQNEQLISSSILRNLASQNQLSIIKNYLGRNLQYTARIIYGKQLGRKYNVPTINLNLGRNKPALHGIYVAVVHIEGVTYNAVASIGKHPTTDNKSERYHLEAHLLDVNLNLYGKIAMVEILEFLRHEEKFTNLDTLFRQIHLDIEKSRQYFLKY